MGKRGKAASAVAATSVEANDRNKKKNGNGKRTKVKQKTMDPVVDLVKDVVSLGIWPEWPEDCTTPCPFVSLLGDVVRTRAERFVLMEDSIFSVPNILSPAECNAWIEWGELSGFAEAKQAANGFYAHRNNGRIAQHNPEVASAIFQRVKALVPPEIDSRRAIGCSSNIRLYRYTPGQRFGKHIDESVLEVESQAWSEFTLLFYLNDEGLQGGDTVFYKGNTGAKEVLRVAPKSGSALLHWHGDRCLLHEGAAVLSGVKYLLRTDVLYK
eukprot:CAMPEP_0184540750 /NCGR_PEP_ID=MMETSP0199_2-20130426/906_1 /TAXON_ID=1112570 /ORGANISM="Thraustochytrium sp., Strain LLF1b" /LENGTH=268 /DNA_ID=CAMNT_0026934403 /DNA_START=57 /DNA_END=863 /DNA_ORIENTATION=+